MKLSEMLQPYLHPSSEIEDKLWGSAAFCFDANVLLNVYRYSDSSRDEFFATLAEIRDRIFMPHQVAVEFGRNRADAIKIYFDPLAGVFAKIDAVGEELDKLHAKYEHIKELKQKIAQTKSLFGDKLNATKRKFSDLRQKDAWLERLIELFGDSVCEPVDEKLLTGDYAARKSESRPPFCGKDELKPGGRGTGDVAIWLEMIRECESRKSNLIFVTDDNKANWWVDGIGGRLPQPSLILEAKSKNIDMLFYSSVEFMQTAKNRLNIRLTDRLIEETKSIRDQEQVKHRPERATPAILRLIQGPESDESFRAAVVVATMLAGPAIKNDERRFNKLVNLIANADPQLLKDAAEGIRTRYGHQSEAITPTQKDALSKFIDMISSVGVENPFE